MRILFLSSPKCHSPCLFPVKGKTSENTKKQKYILYQTLLDLQLNVHIYFIASGYRYSSGERLIRKSHETFLSPPPSPTWVCIWVLLSLSLCIFLLVSSVSCLENCRSIYCKHVHLQGAGVFFFWRVIGTNFSFVRMTLCMFFRAMVGVIFAILRY